MVVSDCRVRRSCEEEMKILFHREGDKKTSQAQRVQRENPAWNANFAKRTDGGGARE